MFMTTTTTPLRRHWQHVASQGHAAVGRCTAVGAAVASILLSTAAAAPAETPAAPAAQVRNPQTTAAAPPSAASNAVLASMLHDLGLALLLSPSVATGSPGNAVLSPLSAAAAMGLVHAGTAGETQREIGLLLATAAAPQLGMARQLPGLLQSLEATPTPGRPLTMANRVWVTESWKGKIQKGYQDVVRTRFDGDLVAAPFDKPPAAVQLINGWASEATKGLITTLVNESVLQPDTRAVVTNAIHFKAPWAKPFDGKLTKDMPFGTGDRKVPTMTDTRDVMSASVAGVEIYELPFRGDEFSLLVAMPGEQKPLQAVVQGLSGLGVAEWRAALTPRHCTLQLPKFSIQVPGISLKPALQELGVKTAFTLRADFTPMLGSGGTQVQLSDVLQSASITIDETGGEAAAATAAVIRPRATALPEPCAINRPFFYALLHKPSGAPVFIGRVTEPAAR